MPKHIHVWLHTRDAEGPAHAPAGSSKGGQFVSGSGGGGSTKKESAASSQQKEARQEQAKRKIKTLAGASGKVSTEAVWGKGHWIDPDESWSLHKPREATISLKNMYPTQPDVKASGLNQYVEKPFSNKSLPEVVELKNGGYAILDGHHRLTATRLKGFLMGKVQIVGKEK